MLFRLTGSLQFLELITLDYFLKLLPPESRDERIVIVGIDETDIQKIENYPIPDQEIASLLKKLQSYKPRVIGLDIVRDLPVEPGNKELVTTFEEFKNLIVVEKILPEQIQPPPLPKEQIGFADVLLDSDGNARRSLLGMYDPKASNQYKFSFSLLLAKYYLEGEGITIENGIKDTHTMRFAGTELPRLWSNYGGYVGADVVDNSSEIQVLLNFRRGRESFRFLSLQDIKTENFQPNLIRDRAVIIGITAASIKDTINTEALTDLEPAGKIYGVEFHAHATSQIISAVLDERLLLKSWSDTWEYLWIFTWGLLAITLGRFTPSALTNLVAVGVTSLIILGIGYVLLLVWGCWIPIVPAILILVLNGVAYTTFYQNQRALKSLVYERQCTINDTFTTIHNGPLQTLANILRRSRCQELSQEELVSELEALNKEIREIGEYLKNDSIPQEENFFRESLVEKKNLRLGSGVRLDLTLPIHELLYTVYNQTIKRKNFPNFTNIKAKIIKFEPIESRYLSFKQKEKLCQFLEEALCNIGKYATGVTRLIISGRENQSWYTLSIQDNGAGISSNYEGRGTKQFKVLAILLGGKFQRKSVSPHGTLCELTWRLTDKHWSLAIRQLLIKLMFINLKS
ncbi:MAG: CHASE2 domain-containing protein [Symploca sp. SIO1C4]|uniref:CHASE2 domain-containing protein n=1 Tax=Symploca sp. SIO1C4 TaxID=2607765 RepID=A0A6B3NGC8_9CYAN|nr:CHASE2 domain-containing protein [Symploca sp. SIO1C4]